jgi:hypothetical protein
VAGRKLKISVAPDQQWQAEQHSDDPDAEHAGISPVMTVFLPDPP